MFLVFGGRQTVAAPLDKFLDAIHQVESSGATVVAPYQDNGSIAIGPLSIHKEFWIDSRVKGEWNDCNDLSYSQTVTIAYLERYCPKAVENNSFETLSRVFNGGPKGYKNPKTVKYWKKVEKILNK